MDRTPKISRSSVKHNPSTTNDIQCSPVWHSRMFSELDNDDSPVHIASTQEGCENVDVIWDWNSPQAKQPKRSKKRLILSQSPKILKRHPSNNNIQNFEKLREELQSLREAIALPDNEESLALSPVEEAEYKRVDEPNVNDILPPTHEIYLEGNDHDLLNDSLDEDLILCTQRIEADLEGLKKEKGCSNNLINSLTSKNIIFYGNARSKSNPTFQLTQAAESENGSSTNVSQYRKIEKKNNFIGNIVSNCRDEKNSAYLKLETRTKSENRFKFTKPAGKVEFHRTQSFESTLECSKEVIPQHKLDEIEKKRKEALAKLESKKKQESNFSASWKCSPEEIEQKRLQALAKLEAKRIQETIERKRQEALKRRELSRQKNAVVVKSFLSKRL